MSLSLFPTSPHLAARAQDSKARRLSRAQAFGSRRNGQPSGQQTKRIPQTQLAAIQVLDPEEELVSANSFDSISDDDDSPPGLSTQQVQTLLSTICNDTELAEVELKIGSFDLKVRRSIAKEGGSAAQSFPQQFGSPFVSTSSMDQNDFSLPSPAPTEQSQQSADEDDEETENHVQVESHKVGVMRRGRYVKGKKVGKGPIADVGAQVKKGQVVCFVEQLGTFIPIETQQAGEIATFLCEEGASVEYSQPLLEIAPYFGGHIIGDRKLT